MRLQSLTAKHAGVIEVYDNAFTNCPEILRYIERTATWTPARIGHGDGETDTQMRNNAVTFFDPFMLSCPNLLRDFAATVWRYLDDYAQRYSVTFAAMEAVNINRYHPGEYYKPHADAGPGHNRQISALVYLNDVSEGGQTSFIYHEVSVSPREGRLVIFPSDYAYSHAAHPPAQGTKYSAAFWTVR